MITRAEIEKLFADWTIPNPGLRAAATGMIDRLRLDQDRLDEPGALEPPQESDDGQGTAEEEQGSAQAQKGEGQDDRGQSIAEGQRARAGEFEDRLSLSAPSLCLLRFTKSRRWWRM